MWKSIGNAKISNHNIAENESIQMASNTVVELKIAERILKNVLDIIEGKVKKIKCSKY